MSRDCTSRTLLLFPFCLFAFHFHVNLANPVRSVLSLKGPQGCEKGLPPHLAQTERVEVH